MSFDSSSSHPPSQSPTSDHPSSSVPSSSIPSSSVPLLPRIVPSADTSHSFERRLVQDFGLFRADRPVLTVDRLLKDRSASASATSPFLSSSSKSSSSLVRSSYEKPIPQDPNRHLHPSAPPKSTDFALISSLTSRLSVTEKLVADQSRELEEKTRKIQELEAKLISATATATANHSQSHSNDDRKGDDYISELELDNERLRRQIYEMEQFLTDYGLVWVGYRAEHEGDNDNGINKMEKENDGNGVATAQGSDKPMMNNNSQENTAKSTGAASVTGTATGSASSSASSSEIYFDVSLLLESIRTLNASHSIATSIVTESNGVTKFRPPPTLTLTIYRDGIVFRHSTLRRYHQLQTRQLITDFMDGYFPTELKSEYPDGVHIITVDRSNQWKDPQAQSYSHSPGFKPFQGPGNRLIPSMALADTGKGNAIQTSHNSGLLTEKDRELLRQRPVHTGPSESAEAFLSRLPNSVIANGKVVDIRNGVSQLIKQTNHPTRSLIETPTLKFLSEQAKHSGASRPSTPRDIATLQVKIESNPGSVKNPPCLIKLRFHDTIDTLYQFVANERTSRGLQSAQRPGVPFPFELRTAFPPKVHLPSSQTLSEAGLTPNSSLFVRPIPSAPTAAATNS